MSYNANFDINSEGTPAPYGFGALFFQTYWSIIQRDVVDAALDFFTFS